MENLDLAPQFKHLNIGIKDLKFKFKIVEMAKLKAIVTVDFGDFVLKGFRVQISDYGEGEEKLWITPPSYQDSGRRYHPMFYAPNKGLWEEMQKMIIEEYKKASAEHYKKRFDLDDT